MEQYHELTQRTSAPVTPEMVGRMREPQVLADLAYLLARFRDLGHMIDKLKKYVFYGKGPYSGERPETTLTDAAAHQIRYEWEVKFLHGTIGIIGESAELADAIFKWLYQQGAPLNIQNIIEELGDHSWFAEEVVAALQQAGFTVTMDEVRKANILKLATRFGAKFSQDSAIIRNLERERFAIEGAFTQKSMADIPGQMSVAETKAAAIELANTIVDDSDRL